MKVFTYFGAVLLIAGLTASQGGAQVVVTNVAAYDDVRPNVLHVVTGFEYAFIAGMGYTRGFDMLGRTVLVSGSVTTPVAGTDPGDYSTRVGVTMPLAGTDAWRLGLHLGGSAKGTRNSISEMTALGADGALVGGYYRSRWFVAGEGGYDNAIATHIDHTHHYRDEFEDVKDGWYVDTGANIRLGVAGGVTFGRYDLVARLGHARDRTGNRQLVPGYATVGASFRF